MRKLMVVGMLVMFLSATTYALAEDVFITQKGAKYHKEECRLIKNRDGVTKLEKNEAAEQGYGPCGRCFKQDAAAVDGKKVEHQAKKSK